MTACRSFQHERSYTWKPKALASWRAYRRISLVWCGNVHRGCHNLRFHLDRVVSLSCWVFDFISHFDFPQGVGAASPRRKLRNLVIDQRFRGRRSRRPNQFCWKTRRPACEVFARVLPTFACSIPNLQDLSSGELECAIYACVCRSSTQPPPYYAQPYAQPSMSVQRRPGP